MTTNKPLNAPFGWMGGKSKLRPTLAALIPEQDIPMKNRKIQHCVEVFGGVAWLLLYKDKWFQNEVYNDINDGLVNLFSVIRFHPDELLKEIELVVNSQKLFNYYKDTLHLTDIQKAAGTLIKYGWSFSAQGTSYAFEVLNSAQTLISKISDLRERFRNVAISNESFEKCIQTLGQGKYLPLPRPAILRR
ncbi:D12 class N6 adenine-specific DNA methyltransferase [Brevinema andersonii]|uniref:D12 class N6 adenine-specific DNA methyltransferase n=1 Tax=Brevinema andersonii TaxID=34097 RepID=A0A1I1F345_BREAD|nr:DNA adenine methylase [Brevinema andersonii]SFB93677.1 D12 class N6 adenine-specific DNA methyltransferase [Brevinema andersonii]